MDADKTGDSAADTVTADPAVVKAQQSVDELTKLGELIDPDYLTMAKEKLEKAKAATPTAKPPQPLDHTSAKRVSAAIASDRKAIMEKLEAKKGVLDQQLATVKEQQRELQLLMEDRADYYKGLQQKLEEMTTALGPDIDAPTPPQAMLRCLRQQI